MTIFDNYEPKSKFLTTVKERGFGHQCTDVEGLDDLLHLNEQAGTPVVAYIGFDCTAPSLHIGSLIQIMMLYWWQKCGHKPIVLMGGGTTKVGDPSGKDAARQLLDDAAIQKNMDGIKQVFSQFLEFEDDATSTASRHPVFMTGSGQPDAVIRRHDNAGTGNNATPFDPTSSKAIMVNNDEWLSSLNYIDFLRDYGRFFSVNEMIKQDSVRMRLEREQPLSFLEFNYMVMQGYDFVELCMRYNCVLQMGGSDQWGNILQGLELSESAKANHPIIYKLHNNPKLAQKIFSKLGNYKKDRKNSTFIELDELEEFGITKSDLDDFEKNPLVENDLFGLTTPLLTTASGAKMGKTADGAVWLNAEMFSPYDYWQFWRNVEDADVARFLKLFTTLPMSEIETLTALEGQKINDAKKVLATEVTALIHGREAAEHAKKTAEETFEQGLTSATLPESPIASADFGDGLPVHKLFLLAGLAESGKEARRLIEGGGAKVQDESVNDANRVITLAEFRDGALKLSAGKKRHVLVKII